MADPIEPVTTALLSRALARSALQQQAIAANIANHEVEGYVPVRATFASQVDELSSSRAAAPRLEPVVDANGQPTKVRLDVEMAELARNAIEYQALTRAMNRHLGVLAMAAADGKK
jgi:flagellar basal-body rod protein FlgB